MSLDPDDLVFVAGHAGLAGSAIWAELERRGHRALIGRRSAELDLLDRDATFAFFAEQRPRAVVLAAARVGGIAANATFPIEYLSENMRMELNVMDAARAHDVERLVFIGSAAAYPRTAESPIPESALLTGPPEEAHAGYALAKLAGVQYVRLMREAGHAWSAVLPTNIYGPGDNFHPEWSHVVPALLAKIHRAAADGAATVDIWGTGRARREFLHSQDLATICLLALEGDDGPVVLNAGVGEDVTIAELAQTIAKVAGFDGELVFDTSRSDGVARRMLDTSLLRSLGWTPSVSLEDGLRSTLDWMVEHADTLRD